MPVTAADVVAGISAVNLRTPLTSLVTAIVVYFAVAPGSDASTVVGAPSAAPSQIAQSYVEPVVTATRIRDVAPVSIDDDASDVCPALPGRPPEDLFPACQIGVAQYGGDMLAMMTDR